NNIASAHVDNPPATGSDLSIRISVNPRTPMVSDLITYTAEVSNSGPDAVRDPVVIISLPPGADIVDGPRGDGWSRTQDGTIVLCTRDSVPQGAAPPITVKVTLRTLTGAGAAVAKTATNAADNNDPNLSNNVASSLSYRFTGGGFSCSQARRGTGG